MGSFLADLRHAVRMLFKSPGFTVIAVSALALGIGANTAIFSVVNSVLLKPLPYPESERIMSVMRGFKSGDGGSTSIPKFMAWRKNDVFESLAAYDFAGPGLNLNGGDRPEQVKGIHVSAEFFRVFGVSPVIGRGFTADEDRPGGPRVAILSNDLWKTHFGGDLRQVGGKVDLNGEPYTVVGVMPPGFVCDPPSDIWIPLQPDPNSANQGHYLRAAGRLKPAVSLSAANARMKIAAEDFRRLYPKSMGDDETVRVVPLQEQTVSEIKPALMILLGAVGLVLLIACANVANLLLARASGRQKEIAIRSAIGASRGRVVRQLLTESVLLAAVGGVAGLLVGMAFVRTLLAVAPGNIPRLSEDGAVAASMVSLDWRVLLFAIGVSLFTGVLFGVFPALQISRVDLNTTLKETGGRSGSGMKHNRTRSLLVVSEIALAVVLLIGAALLIQTFSGLRNVKSGVDTKNVLTMRTSLAGGKYSQTAATANFERQVIQRVEGIPGVEAAAVTWLPPMEGAVDMMFIIEGKPAAKAGEPNGDEDIVYATPHYFAALKIPLLRGRLLQESDSEKALPIMLISQAFAKKYFPNDDPIGQRITIGKGAGAEMEDRTRQIVGVVGDVRQNGLDRLDPPIMYIPVAQVADALNKMASSVIPVTWIIRTNTDPMLSSLPIQREILAVDGQMPVAKIRTLEQLIGATLARNNFNMLLLTVFAGVALLLASIGIYGLMAYSVEQRRHEMGIRMALGAASGDLLGLVLGHGARLAAAGVGLGLAAAFGLTRLLQAMLFGVKPTDPTTFAAAAALLGVVAMIACYVPAHRATRIDPVTALRCE